MDQRVKNEIENEFDNIVNKATKRTWAKLALASFALNVALIIAVIL